MRLKTLFLLTRCFKTLYLTSNLNASFVCPVSPLCPVCPVCLVCPVCPQTWNLSKILHSQIFRLKILHRKSA